MSYLDIKMYTVNDAVQIEENAYNQALEDMANKIKEYSGEHYLDCDGYFGGEIELIFRTEEFLDDVLSELKR